MNSTIWREPKEVKIVWITMLAMCDKEGVVEASIPGLADAARVTLEECLASLRVLQGPDPYSRTKAHEGRRVMEVEGGWLILNHAKYRAKLSAEDQRAKAAARQAKWRAKSKPQRGEVRAVLAIENGDEAGADAICTASLPKGLQ